MSWSPALFARNQAYLRERHYIVMPDPPATPSVGAEIRPAANGKPTVWLGTKPLEHSGDPDAEARHLLKGIKGEVHIHFGFGLGRLVNLDRARNLANLIIYEPSPEVWLAAMGVCDMEALLKGRGVVICFHLRSLRYLVMRYRHRKQSVGLVIPPTYSACFPDLLDLFHRSVQIWGPAPIDYGRLYPKIVKNTAANLARFSEEPGCEHWYQRLAGKPGVVLAAGPSLERNIAELKAVRDRVIVFAIARTVSTLERLGLTPDFVVHVETQDFHHLVAGRENLVDATLLVPDQVQPLFWQSFGGSRRFWFVSKTNPICNSIKNFDPDYKRLVIKTGGSVATAAFYLAFCFGCQPLILMGQDLAFTHGRQYLPAPENLHYRTVTCEVPAYNGLGKLVSQTQYQRNLEWYQHSVQVLGRMDPNREFINATEGGAAIEGFQQMSWREVVVRKLRQPVSVPELDVAPVASEQVLYARFYARLRDAFDQYNLIERQFQRAESAFMAMMIGGRFEMTSAHSPARQFAVLGEWFQQFKSLEPLFPKEWDRLRKMSGQLTNLGEENALEVYCALWTGLAAVYYGIRFTLNEIEEGLRLAREAGQREAHGATGEG
ncbi:motility associated factor glycosyltransferase family protein [Acanthopleuribacter pedis]|uniref:Motility associated factor glycosyltransferase family protein n=1 Tax=Acanthopleuribacter pedis TaxID=442870 RepID=A0A8J7Q503_9BACT|nr:6-hydroxymethylpterin diphosphokinase MptE-like protein [Acanthopleuribacter pedis]MBO1318222.1 motility associated factor glycosyltransferase family protein [Acanthopleuribacter pedis]